jgi:hypothetical protein
MLPALLLHLPMFARATSDLNFFGSQGNVTILQGTPAVWNVYLPNFGRPKLSHLAPLDRESYNIQPSFDGRLIPGVDAASDFNLSVVNSSKAYGCGLLAAAPPLEAVAVLLERGLCSFRQKAMSAHNAGFKAILVVSTQRNSSLVPDMTAAPSSNEAVEVPAWAVSRTDGETLRDWLASDHSIRLEVQDIPRRPNAGPFAQDAYGIRRVFAM